MKVWHQAYIITIYCFLVEFISVFFLFILVELAWKQQHSAILNLVLELCWVGFSNML